MRRFIATVLAGLVLVATVAAGRAQAVSDKYFNAGVFCCYVSLVSSQNYWTLNRVWRPTGYTIEMWYETTSGAKVGDKLDTFNNPASDSGGYGLTRGWCYDYADNNYSPVTCQVDG